MFHIHTHLSISGVKTDFPSIDDIRNSFIKRGFQSVGVCADENFLYYGSNCHVYSIPYQFRDFLFMTNCFQGGEFDKVRTLKMFDRQRPFEHALFKIISQDFPFLQKLVIMNFMARRNDQYDSYPLISFNHLLKLNLLLAHPKYAVQFLSEKNTRLPRLTNLKIGYETLSAVTNNFTSDITRLNCAKIKSLDACGLIVRSQNFDSYFPALYKY